MDNFTPTPNIILDEWMKIMQASSFKVLMAICRKTLGWQKESDNISQTQIIEITGLSKNSVIRALKELKDKELINTIERQGITTNYTLNLTSAKIEPVLNMNGSSAKIEPEPVPKLNPQKKKKDTNKRKYIYPDTLNEIQAYAKEKSYTHVDCNFFFKYFKESNWHDMNNKIVKNWKLKLLTWEETAKNKNKSSKEFVPTNPENIERNF